MWRLQHPTIVVLLALAAPASAQEPSEPLDAAQQAYEAQDFDGVLKHIEPLLKADDLNEAAALRARVLAASAYHRRGEQRFRRANIAAAIADFDREVELEPSSAPEHWQRGIAYYYAGEFDKGARQFKLHQTVNPEDVENAAWHFLCAVRAPHGSVKRAQKELIAVTRDSRPPMAEIQKMFAGQLEPEDVLRAAEPTDGAARFYADLYIGLYYEALGRKADSLHHITLAANNPAAQNNYMGDVARVHVKLRTKKPASAGNRRSPTP